VEPEEVEKGKRLVAIPDHKLMFIPLTTQSDGEKCWEVEVCNGARRISAMLLTK
jgi:hypothetical protein